tara:strand:- start:350 stop:1477 length:1128 start_codon:yes stop_codon:yes gene_type:complete
MLFLLAPLICLSQEKEIWVDKPFAEWPQIALTNHVQFQNGDRYIAPSFTYAGTGFTIDTVKDTLAATAKHVLWIAKNVKSSAVQLNDQLDKWIMKPKGDTKDSVLIDRLINEDSTEVLEGSGSTITERDWLVFSIKKTDPNIYPLKPRYTTLPPNEKVYILSCAYGDSNCTVMEGKLLRKEGMDLLLETTGKNRPGSSGSPVIDSNGHLVGILSSATMDNTTGKSIIVAVSTEYLYEVLHEKKGYNTPKKDYGELLLNTVMNKGAKEAVKQYQNLIKDPKNYYSYNLRSSNRNGLREVGEKLIGLNKIDDAIEILELNAKVNSSFFINHNLLAKAYVMNGNKKEAINSYRLSIQKFGNQDRNEAFGELAKLAEKY